MLKVLEEDFRRIPALLERDVGPAVSLLPPLVEPEAEPVAVQLGLF